MANPLLKSEEDEMPKTARPRATTKPMTVIRRTEGVADMPHWREQPTYHPTRWPILNSLLGTVDDVTRGKAGWVQRLVTYLFVGGFAAIVNLVVFTIMYAKVWPPTAADTTLLPRTLHYLAAFAPATEISILANVIPNDYLSIRPLPGHSRSWLLRCLRFHATCVMGTLLTLVISYTMHLIGLHATLGQAIALIVVTAFNFTMHHVFTYRHTDKPQVF
jgi:putative flippase GtrA